MTALTEFERLEAPALWRPSAYQQRREVIVSVGDATLAIVAPDEQPLAHWSLSAIERRNPGAVPAIYAPGSEARETLEIDDATMIDAIERVRMSVARRSPRRGRVRVAVLSLAMAGLVVAGVIWLPEALVRLASQSVPPAIRAETGGRLLEQMTRLAGAPCRNESARAPLDALARRLLGPGGGQIVVLPDSMAGAALLPGRTVVVDRALIEDYDGPEEVAGYVLAALARADTDDPMDRLIRLTGPRTAITLLTRGEVPARKLSAYAERIVSNPQPEADSPALASRFARAGVSLTPYARARDRTGDSLPGLTGSDAVAQTDPPILSDGQWVALQSVCGE